MGGGTLDFKDSTEFQRQMVTARRYTASTNNVFLETEICGRAEQALTVKQRIFTIVTDYQRLE